MSWSLTKGTSGIQPNGNDCGIFTCKNAANRVMKGGTYVKALVNAVMGVIEEIPGEQPSIPSI